MQTKQIVIAVVLIIVIIVAWYGYKEYNRKNVDLSTTKPDYAIDALSLIGAFEKDSAASNKKYTDKIIAVNGNIKKIDAEENPVILFLGDAGQMSSVQCSMDSSHVAEYKTLKEGTSVTIKGLCTGYEFQDLLGTDVKLTRSVIENKK
ncbi:MAG: hypothetical protein ICV66_08335 [Chitinophagaceae bacterium]|nr:hypothetical protein [Chitinophagaceae bacterium]